MSAEKPKTKQYNLCEFWLISILLSFINLFITPVVYGFVVNAVFQSRTKFENKNTLYAVLLLPFGFNLTYVLRVIPFIKLDDVNGQFILFGPFFYLIMILLPILGAYLYDLIFRSTIRVHFGLKHKITELWRDHLFKPIVYFFILSFCLSFYYFILSSVDPSNDILYYIPLFLFNMLFIFPISFGIIFSIRPILHDCDRPDLVFERSFQNWSSIVLVALMFPLSYLISSDYTGFQQELFLLISIPFMVLFEFIMVRYYIDFMPEVRVE